MDADGEREVLLKNNLNQYDDIPPVMNLVNWQKCSRLSQWIISAL
ncbi:hypothetical protein MTYM_00197 [Methylococcales bacterium]|nr:hypothetical protein MTYM_00197 [Methylococcales bacterium]